MLKRLSPLWLALLMFSCVLLNGCAASSDADTSTGSKLAPIIPLQPSNNDASYAAPKQIGTITDPQLPEISGLVPSHTVKGAWWVHNDSGDQARLYAINSRGQLLAKFTVSEAKNVDWEDLASGPGGDG